MIRCVIADDHPALVSAIDGYLRRNGIEVVARASNGTDALAAARFERPDVALVDYRMPRLGGSELIRRLRAACPDVRVAVYTAAADPELAAEAFAAGADAIVLKEAPLPDLLRALSAALEGRRYVDPAIEPAPGRTTRPLTARELDVLRLLAEGSSHHEIGRHLGISTETVRSHARKAAVRLGARTRTQAVATALRQGLIS